MSLRGSNRLNRRSARTQATPHPHTRPLLVQAQRVSPKRLSANPLLSRAGLGPVLGPTPGRTWSHLVGAPLDQLQGPMPMSKARKSKKVKGRPTVVDLAALGWIKANHQCIPACLNPPTYYYIIHVSHPILSYPIPPLPSQPFVSSSPLFSPIFLSTSQRKIAESQLFFFFGLPFKFEQTNSPSRVLGAGTATISKLRRVKIHRHFASTQPGHTRTASAVIADTTKPAFRDQRPRPAFTTHSQFKSTASFRYVAFVAVAGAACNFYPYLALARLPCRVGYRMPKESRADSTFATIVFCLFFSNLARLTTPVQTGTCHSTAFCC